MFVSLLKKYSKSWQEANNCLTKREDALKREEQRLDDRKKRIENMLSELASTNEHIVAVGENSGLNIVITRRITRLLFAIREMKRDVCEITINAYYGVASDYMRKHSVCALSAKVDYHVNDNKVILNAHICDFGVDIQHRGEGIGSLALKNFLQTAYELGIVKVTGDLSGVDELDPKNNARRDHVYKKHGFVINDDYVVIDNLQELYKT
jgi:GNAT superfamily N-acetyltransferase